MKTNMYSFVSITNFSNLMSSATSAILDAITGKFPKDFIKTINVDGSFASINKQANQAGTKARLPVLNIKPVYQIDKSESNLTMLGYRSFLKPSDGVIYQNYHHMPALYGHDDTRQSIRYELNRVALTFNVQLVLNTPIQMMNVQAFLNNALSPDNLHFINNVPLPVEVPRNMISILAADAGVDISDALGLKAFIQHLDTFSRSKVDFRINPSNGNKTVAFFLPTNLLCRFSPPTSSLNKNAESQDRCYLDFEVKLDIPYPTYFLCVTAKKGEIPDTGGSVFDDEGSVITLHFELDDSIPNHIEEKTLRVRQVFVADANSFIEKLPFEEVLDPTLKKFVDEIIAAGTPVTDHVITRIYRSGSGDNFLKEGIDFTINWERQIITLYQPEANVNYCLGMYIDYRTLKPYEMKEDGIDPDMVFDEVK